MWQCWTTTASSGKFEAREPIGAIHPRRWIMDGRARVHRVSSGKSGSFDD